MKHRGGSPAGGSHHCFSWSPVERPCYHNREPGHLISSVVEVWVPSLKNFPELSMSQGLKPLLCSGKWIPSLWTTMVSYEWPCMPCDIIAVLWKGHGNVAPPLKHTHPRIPRTFGWLQCFLDASAQSWKTLHESGCWADSTIQKEDQWCGFRGACKSKLCRSLPSDLFAHVTDFSGKHLREHLDSGCAAVSFIGSAHGHSLFLGAGYQVQYWCRHCMKKRKKPKRSEAQTWEGFKKHGRDGGLNRPPTDLNTNKTDLEKGQGPYSSHLREFMHIALCTTSRNPHHGGCFLILQFWKSLPVSKRDVLTSTSPWWLCLLGSHLSTEAFKRTGSLLQAESSLQKAKSRRSQTCYQSKRRRRCRSEERCIFSLFYCNSIVVGI